MGIALITILVLWFRKRRQRIYPAKSLPAQTELDVWTQSGKPAVHGGLHEDQNPWTGILNGRPRQSNGGQDAAGPNHIRRSSDREARNFTTPKSPTVFGGHMQSFQRGAKRRRAESRFGIALSDSSSLRGTTDIQNMVQDRNGGRAELSGEGGSTQRKARSVGLPAEFRRSVYPMKWCGVLIPVLPQRLIQALEAPEADQCRSRLSIATGAFGYSEAAA
ncbi:uncharacterized protein LTR77_010468 [Saxophila tyrrhenica]|uniref:Uncharacterized protein n=1 Tax=Saxophila tyrrhenica TaxID=1690608 RepID=A0AAV9NVZ1_9PEZI|nr:hypothetical protein LTR77_010468 [Saxophila tyrrhenica]